MGRPQQGRRDQSQCPLPICRNRRCVLEGRRDVCCDSPFGSSATAAVGPCDSGPGVRRRRPG
eukprot:3945511-Alexandrium_andersonii.AAC.1